MLNQINAAENEPVAQTPAGKVWKVSALAELPENPAPDPEPEPRKVPKTAPQVPQGQQPTRPAVQTPQVPGGQPPVRRAVVPAPQTPAPVVTVKPQKKTVVPIQKKIQPPRRTVRFIYVEKQRYLLLQDVAGFCGMAFQFTKSGALMGNKYHRIEFTYNKRIGELDGVTVHFLSPMLIQKRLAYISELDYRKVLAPVLQNKALNRLPVRTVMIDPGHGGKDRGAPGPVSDEKTINLQIAMKLKAALLAKGFKVAMTRVTDVFPSLQQRAEFCEKVKPDLFISIHCNATGSASVDGVETYLTTPENGASTSDSKPSGTPTPGNDFDSNNYRLAYEVQKSLVTTLKAEDRGVRHARFFVIRNAVCPAILIESGFLSNNREGRLLAQAERQNQIVQSVMNGIFRYNAAASSPEARKPGK